MYPSEEKDKGKINRVFTSAIFRKCSSRNLRLYFVNVCKRDPLRLKILGNFEIDLIIQEVPHSQHLPMIIFGGSGDESFTHFKISRSRPEVFDKKGFFKRFCKIDRKTYLPVSLFK